MIDHISLLYPPINAEIRRQMEISEEIRRLSATNAVATGLRIKDDGLDTEALSSARESM